MGRKPKSLIECLRHSRYNVQYLIDEDAFVSIISCNYCILVQSHLQIIITANHVISLHHIITSHITTHRQMARVHLKEVNNFQFLKLQCNKICHKHGSLEKI